jgi:photosystem II stability/assembly factor-like uncharacterized protein
MPLKLFLILSFLSCLPLYAQKSEDKKLDFTEFDMKECSIRAMVVVNDSVVWFAGSNGKYGRITNGTLEIDSIAFDDTYLHFRSIAYNGESVFFLSIGSPAILYKKNALESFKTRPTIVYGESHETIFYDAMAFADKKNGIAMGDPTENCLSVIVTKDGGNKWFKTDCSDLPEIVEGEAAFAASNSNIALFENNIWIVTGGAKARVFHSPNFGKKWKVYETPILQGGKMTGIYSVDFYDENIGIIMGGDWENKKNTNATKAMTYDGGKTWNLMADGEIPGYISCVQFVPNTHGKELAAVSTEGIYYSKTSGKSWTKISNEGYYSIRFVHQHLAWLSGNNKIAQIYLD